MTGLSSITTSFARLPAVTRGILWMIMASFCYAALYIAVRQTTRTLPVAEVVFFRAAMIAVLMLPWLSHAGLRSLHTRRAKLHFMRATMLYSASFVWMYAIVYMPITDVNAIQFATPLFTVIFTVIFLHEVVGLRRWAALFVGFIGVLVILRPGFVEIGLPAMAALAGSALFAAGHACARALGATEAANTSVFYLYIFMAALGLIPTIIEWQTPNLEETGWLIAMAAITLAAQQGLTRGLKAAPASVVMPLHFLQLPFVAIFGLVLFNELSDIWTWVGASVIFGSTWYISRREARLARAARDAAKADR